MRTRLGWIVLLFLSSVAAHAASYTLFRGGIAAPDYDKILKEAQAGDTLVFSDGRSFVIDGAPMIGGTNILFPLRGEPGKLLRLPRGHVGHRWTLDHQMILSAMIEGENAFRRHAIPHAKILDSHDGKGLAEWAVMERVRGNETMKDVLREYLLDPHDAQALEKLSRLKTWVEKTSEFTAISDFRFDQILWDTEKKEWILIDWLDSQRTKTWLDPKRAFQHPVISELLRLRANSDPVTAKKLDALLVDYGEVLAEKRYGMAFPRDSLLPFIEMAEPELKRAPTPCSTSFATLQ